MKELIPRDEYGIFADTQGTVRVDSRFVAAFFGKRHKDVVRDIEKITAPSFGLSDDFLALNFERIKCRNAKGKKQRAYSMTRDAFEILARSYHDPGIAKVKETYIRRFDEKERQAGYATAKHKGLHG